MLFRSSLSRLWTWANDSPDKGGEISVTLGSLTLNLGWGRWATLALFPGLRPSSGPVLEARGGTGYPQRAPVAGSGAPRLPLRLQGGSRGRLIGFGGPSGAGVCLWSLGGPLSLRPYRGKDDRPLVLSTWDGSAPDATERPRFRSSGSAWEVKTGTWRGGKRGKIRS